MENSPLVPHLIRFCEDQKALLGEGPGGRYVARCLALWGERYGESVALMVRERLAKGKS
jgi:hypothetical protein